jgi:trimethylamine-N-oxide reductase (cytochrome c)
MPGMSEIKMIYQHGAGFLRWVDPNSRVKAFMSPKIETFLVQAIWFEEAARYADILLPAATNFERMDVSEHGVFWGWYLGSVNWRIAIYNKKAIEPVFESKDDLEIYYELAKRIGIYDEFTEGNTQEDWLKKLYALSSYPDYVSYDDFKAKGFAMVNFPADYTPRYALRWYHDKPEGEGLDTADGKFDIYAPYLAKQYGDHDPEISPIPKYYPPKDQVLATKYPLRLRAPHPRRRYHQMHNNSWAKELSKIKIRGYDYEPMWINPVDAKALGIKNEGIVKVTSKTGAILAAAYVTERIFPGVVRIDYGTDWDPDDPRNPWLDRAGSTNVLLDNEPISKHCYGEHLAHGMVQVEKWG